MSTEIMRPDSAEITPMQMIQVAFDAAIKQGSAMEVVNLILEQQKWMIQHSEEEAFNAALKRIQKKLKSITKKGWNPDTKSRFATSEDIDKEIQGLLDDENMTLSFRPGISDKPDMVLVTGILSLGAFSKEYPLEMPADGKGAKGGGVMSRTHATGAAITYAKRYLKNMIFDLRFQEENDDGSGASVRELDDTQFLPLEDNMKNAENMPELQKFFAVAWQTAVDAKDMKSKAKFKEIYEARKKELSA